MASIQKVQQLRVTGTHDSNVAQGAARDAAALRDMADAADMAAAAGERLGQKARVTNEELRRGDPTLAAINKKIDENARLTSETSRANAVYRKSVDEIRAAQQLGKLTAEQAAESERRLAMIRDGTIQKATILAERMRQQFTVAGIANQNMADSAAGAYQQLLAGLDPVIAQQQRYQAEMNSAMAIINAANVSDTERTRVLNLVSAAYDPVTIASNRRTAAIYAEMDALRQSIALANEEVRARAAQAGFNDRLGVRDYDTGAARMSASVFAEDFARQDQLQRELAETAAAEEGLIATRQRLRAQFDPLFAAQARYEQELKEISTALEMQAIDEQLAGKARAAALASYQRHNQEVARGAVGMSRFSQAVGQGGLQLQDLVVQLGAGTSAFVAIGQQLPQFLGIFGPSGAIAGAVVAIAAVAGNLLTMGDSAERAADETSALDKVLGPLTRTIDDQANSLKDLITKYNEAGAAQQVLSRLKLSASLVETTEKLNKQKEAFDELLQSLLATQEFQTTAGAVPISAANVVKFGRPDFDIQQTPALADDPVIKLAMRIRDLRQSGDFVGVTDLISKFGKAGEEAGRKLLGTASSITELDRQGTQASTFLNLLEQGLVKNFNATKGATGAANDYTEVLAGLAGDRAYVAALAEGEEGLRHLAREQAVLAAETKVFAAAHKAAWADGSESIDEYNEKLRLTAEAGKLAGQRFDLEATRKGAYGMKEIAAATRAFKDELEDANRFLAEQAGGVSVAEKAYRPFAAQIEKMNDLLGRKGLSDPQRTEALQTIARLEKAGATAMKEAADDAERAHQQRMMGLEQETVALEDRNRIAQLEQDGTYEARRAIIDLNTTRSLAHNELERQASISEAIRKGEIGDLERINELYNRRGTAIRDAANIANDNIYAGEAQQFSQLVQQALVDGSVDASAIIRSGIATAVDQPLKDFYKDFRKTLEDAAPGIGKVIGDTMVGSALGDLLGDLLGRDSVQNRNAKIGGTIGGAVGQFLPGGSKVWAFVGNVIGGMFGPGKSDATAGAQIYTRDDRIQNFDTSANKQDAGNMSARDALAQSVMQYTNLLETLGGKLSSIVAIEVGSRDGNRWRVTDQTGQIVNSGTTAVGDIEGTLSQVLAAITGTLTGIPETLKARLQAVDFSELSRAESDVNFILSYDLAIRKMSGTLEGGADAVEAARQQVQDLRGEVEDFSSTAARLGFDTATTADALRAQVERFAGIGAAVPQMTEVERQVAALAASFGQLAPVLEAVGYGATEAAAAVQRAEAARMASLRANVVNTQDRRYDDLIGNGYLNDIRDLISQRDTDIRDATAVGLSDAGAQRNFGAAISGVLTTDLRADQLQEAIRLFGDIPAVASAANAALSALATGITDTASTARSAADIANERAGLERQLLEAQGDTAAIQALNRAALDESNRSIFDQIAALGAQKAATEAATEAARREADVTRSLADRVAALADAGRPDASIRELERRQQAEFRLAQESGHTADQLRVLADVLAGEMTRAVTDLNTQTAVMSEGLQTRLLRAQAANPLLEQAARDALEAQATQIERARELASASNDNVRAMLTATYAAQDLALANQKQADAAAEAARQADQAAQALERIQGMGGSIRGWVDQARGGGIEGFLSPAEQLANAQAAFQRQLALAAANDNVALGSITSYADRMIQAQTGFAGSGGNTQAMIAQTLAALEALPAVKSFDQQQIDLLEDILDRMDANGDGIVTALERAQYGISQSLAGLPTPTATQLASAIAPYFGELDSSLDGLLSPAEFTAGLKGLATDAVLAEWFRTLDQNGDGLLTQAELNNRAVINLGGGSGDGTLLAVGRLIYAGNVDRLNLVNATNQGLVTLGLLIGAGNAYLSTIAAKNFSITVNGAAVEPQQPTGPTPYYGGYDPARDAAYLARYADVKAAIGNYANAYEHYNAYGRMEGRTYATGTDFHPGGAAIVHAGEMLLPPDAAPRGMKVLTARETADLMRPVNINMPAGRNDSSMAIQELVREVRQLRRENKRIAEGQATQQSGEMSEQNGVLRTIARHTAQKRATLG